MEKSVLQTSDRCQQQPDFIRSKHVKFFKRCLSVLPAAYASIDTSRVTVAFFAVNGLDLLGALDEVEAEERTAIVNWIYLLQVSDQLRSDRSRPAVGGFLGSTCCGTRASHLAMTYTALATLSILGDDLRRVDRAAVAAGIRELQMPDGSFRATLDGGEEDMRFVYCAACVSHMLGDWSGLDIDRASAFIASAQTYEGGFGQRPYGEAHGGSTFCAIAALVLMQRLDSVLTQRCRDRLLRWLSLRQVGEFGEDLGGYQGRPNKQADACYSFWVGASLHLLGFYSRTVSRTANRSFLMSTQDPITGGFAKWPGLTPDALHAYMGVAGLALMDEPGISALDPALNVSARVASTFGAAVAAAHIDSRLTAHDHAADDVP